MRILHISPVFYPAVRFGGPVVALFELCNALAQIDSLQLRVLTTDALSTRRYERITPRSYPERSDRGYDIYYRRRVWGVSVSPGLLRQLPQMIRRADVVHLTAAYSFPTIPTLALCRLLHRPVVWSPRGSLQSWEQRKRRRLKGAWNSICRLCQPSRLVLHSTSRKEAEESARLFPDVKTLIVPNGFNLPAASKTHFSTPPARMKLAFFGLLSPKKGLENLLRALTLLPVSQFELHVYGEEAPGFSGYSDRIKRLIGEWGLDRQVTLHGFVHGASKDAAWLASDICVIPSFSENFCNVAGEALAYGVPIVVSRGVPWERVEQKRCGYWVDNAPESLASTLGKIDRTALADMGRRGRAWIAEEFSWTAIARQMEAGYRSLLDADSDGKSSIPAS